MWIIYIKIMGNCVSSQDDIRNANKVAPVSLYLILAHLEQLSISLGTEIHMVYLITRTRML